MNDAYADAGVSIDAANETVRRYRRLLGADTDARVLAGIGSFGGCFSLQGFQEPVLVASTDGVGTKAVVAAQLARFETLGFDLVNHCINDVLCSNAQPLFFLDYLAMGKLVPQVAEAIVAGIAEACRQHGVALLGGETAEMPGVYMPPNFDLAGTIVGGVERRQMTDPSQVAAGDAIVGLPANGLHTNGYSLARKVLPASRWDERIDGGQTIAEALLAVHPCYLPYVRAIQQSGVCVKGMAHVTGGGLLENLPRAFGEHLAARLRSGWSVPPIEKLLIHEAKMTAEDAHRVLNMGVGFCVIVGPHEEKRALEAAARALLEYPIAGAAPVVQKIGEIEARHPCGPSVIFDRA